MLKFITIIFVLISFARCKETESKMGSIGYFVEVNDSAQVSKWLREGGNPNFFIDSSSLLYIATGPHGGHEVMKLLVKAKADINKGAYKYTPLMNAASWDDYEAVTFLLDNGANPNLTNEKGQTALEVIGTCNCDDEKKTRDILAAVTRNKSR